MPVLLAIDDDPSILLAFRYIFRGPQVKLVTAGSAAEGLARIAEAAPDVILLDIGLPDMSGLDAYRRIQKVDRRVPIIFITGGGSTDIAIEAMKLGAYDYLLKDNLLQPEGTAQLRETVTRAIDISRLMKVPAVVPENGEDERIPDAADVLVGRCPAMQAVYKAIGRVAPQDVTALILGASGTGKELVARAIYQHSKRSQGPFLTINCAAIPETLLESELFGHEKGAFTGAERRRIGKFEQCSGGTLFLDEIGDMTPLTQAKVLRVMQEQRFERVGGNETIQTNVRLIAATNRDLQHHVGAGQFRGDLYYRLSGFTIHLPPLRDRGDDLNFLVTHFVRRFNRELGKEVTQVAPATLDLLRRYSWPGNLRELQSVLKQALLVATGPMLLPDFLPLHLQAGVKPALTADSDWDRFIEDQFRQGTTKLFGDWTALTEKHLLTRVLKFTSGNQVQAARLLGISRNSLRNKIHDLGITIERSVDIPDDPPSSLTAG